VEVVRLDDAAAFLTQAEPLLLADEARHNLILGIAGNVRDGVYEDFRLWLVRDGGEVAGAALRTQPTTSSSPSLGRRRRWTRSPRPSPARSCPAS
jgi:hypothetical protein